MDLNTPNSLKNNLTENQLYKLSLFFAVIGLLTLFGSAQFLKPAQVPVSEITKEMNGKKIQTVGAVARPEHVKGHLFFDLRWRGDSITVAEFDSKRNLTEGQKVKVKGSITVYQGKLEIMANEIEKMERKD